MKKTILQQIYDHLNSDPDFTSIYEVMNVRDDNGNLLTLKDNYDDTKYIVVFDDKQGAQQVFINVTNQTIDKIKSKINGLKIRRIKEIKI